MENIVLTIHLILALSLIGIVLLQRSEGGGLGMGGGGGAMSARAAATALTKVTWGLAVAFIITSITLTVIAAGSADKASVIDQFGGSLAPSTNSTGTVYSDELSLPSIDGSTPVAPPRTNGPAVPPPVAN